MSTNNIFPNGIAPSFPTYMGMNPPTAYPGLSTPQLQTQDDKLAAMQKRIDMLEAKLSEKSADDVQSIEKRLDGLPEGNKFLKIKQEGLLGILTKFALNNPSTADETRKFLDKWQDTATKYIDSLDQAKRVIPVPNHK